MAAVMEDTRTDSILTEAQLEEFRARAPGYDERNEFFHEDFEVLRESGYLIQNVPEELGGMGFSLAEVAKQQRRLAYFAPADALAVNMHLYWTGVAADLWYDGDKSLEWLLREAAAGEVFAAGHAERGTPEHPAYDKPLLYASTKAERVDGGYCFTGHKQFGTLTPVWTRFGVHGIDDSDPENPKIVHGFMTRDTDGYRIEESWDVLGMRATCSQDTVLDAVFVPDKRIGRVVPVGFAGADQFVLSAFAWACTGFGNVYYGMARHALDRVIESVKKKRVVTMQRSMAWHAEVQHKIAEIGIKLMTMEALLDRTADDWSQRVDHGEMWPARIVGTKAYAVENAWQIVDSAFELAGGGGIYKATGWERILRDARLGLIHPANGILAREIVAKSHLGLDLDEEPRWG
jgi:alkylation response protein AidB-like acyl-CoA dehydrogenase